MDVWEDGRMGTRCDALPLVPPESTCCCSRPTAAAAAAAAALLCRSGHGADVW